MSRVMVALMRHMPGIMIWLAVAYYVGAVVVGLAAGTELSRMSDLTMDTLPLALRLKAYVLLFVQPLVNATALLFGAALLWRLDRLCASSASEMLS